MNLKPVELQIALPRTTDAAHLQQQQNQKPINDQMHMAEQNVKQSEEQLKRAAKSEEADSAQIRDDQSGSGKQKQQERDQSLKEKTREQEASHPYKGRHIDLSL